MYLIEQRTFIKQIIPPHWRSTFREKVLSVFLKTIFDVERRFTTYRQSVGVDINLSAQFLVFQEALRRTVDSPLAYVEDGDFDIVLHVPKKTERQPVDSLAKKYIPAGVKYTITQDIKIPKT